jgi:copper chaperone NosL
MKLSGTAALALAALMTACNEEDRKASMPAPQEVTDTAIGQFCGMALNEHPGPKGQIFIVGDNKPFWFASEHDAIAFTMLPEMPKNVAAIYVSDMARARDWARPEPGSWVDAHQAMFVIGSARRSGMDTNEAIPFGNVEAARRFAAVNGGQVVPLNEVPQSYILASGGSSQ